MMAKAFRREAAPAWLKLGGVKGLLLLWFGTLVIWIIIGTDGVFRSSLQDREAADLIAYLDLTAPAYYPAGHPCRHPENQAPGIIASPTPLLPLALSRQRPQWLPEGGHQWEPLP
jgi:hypothetical protein